MDRRPSVHGRVGYLRHTVERYAALFTQPIAQQQPPPGGFNRRVPEPGPAVGDLLVLSADHLPRLNAEDEMVFRRFHRRAHGVQCGDSGSVHLFVHQPVSVTDIIVVVPGRQSIAVT
jgi:hypothetical protein